MITTSASSQSSLAATGNETRALPGTVKYLATFIAPHTRRRFKTESSTSGSAAAGERVYTSGLTITRFTTSWQRRNGRELMSDVH